MAFELTELELEELSLVDRPANAEAKVSLFKRDNSQEEHMEDKQQEIDTLKGEIETLKADAAKGEAERQRLTKALIDNGYTIEADKIEKKAAVEEIEIEGVKVNKAELPEVVVKALEAAQVEKAEAALVAKAQAELPNFSLIVAKAVVKALGDNAEVMQALKAADKVFAQKTEEIGTKSADTDMLSAGEKLEKMAKDKAKADKTTYEVAYAAIVKTVEGKALIQEIYKKD